MSDEQPAITVEPGMPVPGNLKLRVEMDLGDEVRAELREAGLLRGEVSEFSLAPETVVLVVSSATALMASLAAVLRAVLRRHDGKRLVLHTAAGEVVEVTGLALEDIQVALTAAAEYPAQVDEDWRRTSGLDEPPADDEQ